MGDYVGMGEYVGFWRRTMALIIDDVVWLAAPSYVFADVLFNRLAEESPEAAGLVLFVYASLWFNYFSFCEWRWGQTIGKATVGIKVISVDGGKLSFGQASIRNLLRLVDFFVIGWIMIAAGERKQRLGDKAAGTVVVRRAPRAISATAVASRQAAAPPPRAAPAPPPPAPEFAASPYVASAAGTAAPPPAAVAPGPQGNLPAISWSAGTTVKGLLGGLLFVVLVPPLLVLPFDPDFDSEAGLLVAQGLFGLSLIAIAVALASGWEFGRWREALGKLGLRRFNPGALGWMLLMLFAYYVFAGLFSAFVLEPEQDDIGGELGVGDDSLLVAVSAVLAIAVLAPISEELFFRGFLFAGFRSRMSLWPAALLAGAIFGAIHAPTGVTAAIPLAGLGVGLCWLYEKTGSLWPCVIGHTLNNGLALLLLSTTEGVVGLPPAL